jgi:hypothetical protein
MGRMRLMPGDRGVGPAVARPPRPRFAGLSYERASRTAADLIAGANASGDWLDLPEALAELRGVMERHLQYGEPRVSTSSEWARRRGGETSPEYMGL